jgi:hypothetical protein
VLALDLNGDGLPDLVVANRNDRSIAALINSGGEFKPPTLTSLPADVDYLAYADFNHDGHLDLTAAGYDANALVRLAGNGDGTFQTPAIYATGNSPGSIGVLPLGDGNTLVVTTDAISNAVWFTVVSPQGMPGAPPLNFIGGQPTGIAVADFNGDGQPDAIITGAASDVSVFLSQSGQFTFSAGYSLGQPSPAPQAVAIGDLNGDGKPDVVVANSGNGGLAGSVSVLLGNADGTLKPPNSTPVNQNAQGIEIADFNGDGFLDAAIAAYGSKSGGPDQRRRVGAVGQR